MVIIFDYYLNKDNYGTLYMYEKLLMTKFRREQNQHNFNLLIKIDGIH